MAHLPLVRPVHPFAQLFPLMEGAEFDALCKDIKANGLVAPSPCWIAVSSMAATANAPATRWAYRSGQSGTPATIHSVMCSRPTCTGATSTRVSARWSRRSWPICGKVVLAKLRQLAEFPKVQGGELLNVSPRSLQRAKAVYENVITTVVQRVERGEVAVAAATKLIGLPEVEQRRFVDAREATLRKQSAQAYRRRTARAATPIPNGMEIALAIAAWYGTISSRIAWR